jgi:8-oxo-dGTP diphosphatase
MNYVAGFMFSEDMQKVALIRKLKPDWQKGLLNGIGGKVEPGESVFEAVIREFKEETSLATMGAEWEYFAHLIGKDFVGEPFDVSFFTSKGDLSRLRSVTEEKIEILGINSITFLRKDMVENIPWLIGLAIDFLEDGRPIFVEAKYN